MKELLGWSLDGALDPWSCFWKKMRVTPIILVIHLHLPFFGLSNSTPPKIMVIGLALPPFFAHTPLGVFLAHSLRKPFQDGSDAVKIGRAESSTKNQEDTSENYDKNGNTNRRTQEREEYIKYRFIINMNKIT